MCLLGQSADTGAINGTITDPSGRVVPGATITATHFATGRARTATSGGDGTYNIALLPPGVYRLEFIADGFKTAELGAVKVNVTETPIVNQALALGARTDKITVQETTDSISDRQFQLRSRRWLACGHGTTAHDPELHPDFIVGTRMRFC